MSKRQGIGARFYQLVRSALWVGGLLLAAPAQADSPQAPAYENIAPAGVITTEGFSGNNRPEALNDKAVPYIYTDPRWESGTHRSPDVEGPCETLTCSFYRFPQPPVITGVQLMQDPWGKIDYAVEVYDGAQWREVARNASTPMNGEVKFSPVTAYAVRLNLLGRVPKKEETNFPYPYHRHTMSASELLVIGKLTGGDVAPQIAFRFGEDARRCVEQNQPLKLPVQATGIPEGMNVAGHYELFTLYGRKPIEKVSGPVAAGWQDVAFGVHPAGAYVVRYRYVAQPAGIPLAAGEVLLGVRSTDWLAGRTEPFTGNLTKYPASASPVAPTDVAARQPKSYMLSADINGLDSAHSLPEMGYYLDECAKNNLMPEVFIPWRAVEPLPGVYDFTFADTVMTEVTRRGLRARLTGNGFFAGNFPDWMEPHAALEFNTKTNMVRTGAPSLFDATIREHGRRLTMLLMRRYGHHPAAAMWTLNVDGEFLWQIRDGQYTDVSPAALTAYKEHLVGQYRTITQLNRAWGTKFKSFAAITPPVPGFNNAWFEFCRFMLRSVVEYYEPIAAMARRELPASTILGTTGYTTGEAMFEFARKYDVWISSQGMENPQWVQWASILTSSGVTPYGEPGYVNIQKVSLNRSLFLSLVGGLPLYTYRQYGWPNKDVWPEYLHFRTIADKVIGAKPMKVPFALSGTEESGLAACTNSFALGGVWEMAGCFHDALLKLGVTCEGFDGYNEAVLDRSKLVIELGSSTWSDKSLRLVDGYVGRGGDLLVLPSRKGGRVRWDDRSRNVAEQTGDALLQRLGYPGEIKDLEGATPTSADSAGETAAWLKRLDKLAFTRHNRFGELPAGASTLLENARQPLLVEWRKDNGAVLLSGVRPAFTVAYGNTRSGVGGTGWNIRYKSEATQQLLCALLERYRQTLPMTFVSDREDSWACAFEKGEKRLILLYNNEDSIPANVTITGLDRSRFSAAAYEGVMYQYAGTQSLPRQATTAFSFAAEVAPFGLTLIELTPANGQ